VKKLLEFTLDAPEKRVVYHLSDGKGSKEVGQLANIDFSTVTRYWKAWYKVGLMKSMSVKGGERYIKNFNLKDFGIEVPKLPTEVSKTESQPSTTQPTLSQAIEQTQQPLEGSNSQ
jgi:hypothetical protein